MYVDERLVPPPSVVTNFKNHEEVTLAAGESIKEQCASGKRGEHSGSCMLCIIIADRPTPLALRHGRPLHV